MSLICDYQLPLAYEGTDSAWACSLAWLPSSAVAQTTPTFYMSPATEGRVHARLVVGCTNGQVFNLKWEFSGVNGVMGLVSSSVSSLNGVTGVCSITGVAGVTAGVSEAACLWKEADGVPVCCVASQLKVKEGGGRMEEGREEHYVFGLSFFLEVQLMWMHLYQFTDGHLWVLLSKSSLLVAQCLDSNYRTLGEEVGHVEIAGHHRMTISGTGREGGRG